MNNGKKKNTRIKVSLRKEVVRCEVCKSQKEFYYLSDFLYGKRLVYSKNGGVLAFIDMINDPSYSEYYEIAEDILNKYEKSLTKEDISSFVNKSFGEICDLINDEKVDLSASQRVCKKCGSTKFEKNMCESASVVEVELPVISHTEWYKKEIEQKRNIVVRLIEKSNYCIRGVLEK